MTVHNYNFPPLPSGEGLEFAKTQYLIAGLPLDYWDTNVIPRFKDYSATEVVAQQSALTQAQVYNSLLYDPLQLRDIPRRWRLAAYANPIDAASIMLGALVRHAILKRMKVKCCSIDELPAVNKYSDRYELVFVYNVFDDMDPSYYEQLRIAMFKPFHLMYAMASSNPGDVHTRLLRVSPDYVFNIAAASLQKPTRTI